MPSTLPVSNFELICRLIGPTAARRLYRGKLRPMFERPVSETDPAERMLGAARELMLRLLAEELQEGVGLSTPEAVRDYLRLFYAGQESESLTVLFFDAQNHLIAAEELFRGTLAQTSVYPREIVKRAMKLNCSAVILAHNHPSGNVEPSRADEALTKATRDALALIEVMVLDHFVIAGPIATSFAERGLL